MIKTAYGTMYYVDNMKDAVSFYKGTLGATPSQESDEWTEFTVGEHRLCLHIKRPGEKHSANGVLIFNAEGIKSLYEKMKRDGIKVGGLHEVYPGAWAYNAIDATGNETSFHGTA